MVEACCRKHPLVPVSYIICFAIFPKAVYPVSFRSRRLEVRLDGEKRRLTRVSESLAVIVKTPIGAIEDDAAKRLLKGPPMPW